MLARNRLMRVFSVAVLCLWTSCVAAADDVPVDLSKIDRKIVREPAYVGQPHYALFVFGLKAEHRAWFVIDGDHVAYIDRNGNGDLTDPEDRVELDVDATNKIRRSGASPYRGRHVFPLGTVFGTKLDFELWIRNPQFDISKSPLSDWYRELDKQRWVNGSLMRKVKDGTAAQNPLLLTTSPGDAQISHFDGPLTFAFTSEEQQLEPWPKKSAFSVHIGCGNLLAKNCTQPSFGLSRLTTTEVPADLHPVAMLDFLDAEGKSVEQTLKLDQRCCGDQFYALLKLPQGLSGDRVNVKIAFPESRTMQAVPINLSAAINRTVSRYSEQAFVMFHDPKIELKHAVNALRRGGLNVTIQDELLRIPLRGDTTVLAIGLNRAAEVQQTATAIGVDTPFAEALSQCDARFEISFSDAGKALAEKKTLQAVQQALQKLTNGHCYTTWDKQVSPPK